MAAAGLLIWFVIAAWLLFGDSDYIELALAVISVLVFMAIAIPVGALARQCEGSTIERFIARNGTSIRNPGHVVTRPIRHLDGSGKRFDGCNRDPIAAGGCEVWHYSIGGRTRIDPHGSALVQLPGYASQRSRHRRPFLRKGWPRKQI